MNWSVSRWTVVSENRNMWSARIWTVASENINSGQQEDELWSVIRWTGQSGNKLWPVRIWTVASENMNCGQREYEMWSTKIWTVVRDKMNWSVRRWSVVSKNMNCSQWEYELWSSLTLRLEGKWLIDARFILPYTASLLNKMSNVKFNFTIHTIFVKTISLSRSLFLFPSFVLCYNNTTRGRHMIELLTKMFLSLLIRKQVIVRRTIVSLLSFL